MKLKSFFSICASAALLAAGTVHLRAQSLEPFNPYGIFSPSVEAWQMTRYGNLTPSLYTGAMTFSLPLYTYEDPDFTIPISLEYSFDGYRPAQHSGTVGYGWYLNCGGVITREVRGIPDEGDLNDNGSYECQVRGWRQAPASVRASMYTDLSKIYSIGRKQLPYIPESQCTGLITSYDTFSDVPAYAPGASPSYGASVLYDTAPDIYRFNFLGHSGTFVMLANGSVAVYDSDIPYGELGVSFADGLTNDPAHVEITLTTGDGYSYRFVTAGVNVIPDQQATNAFKVSKSVNEYVLAGITAPNGRTVSFGSAVNQTVSITRSYGTHREVQYLTQTLYDNGDGGSSSGDDIFENSVPWTMVKENGCRLTDIIVSGYGSADTTARIEFNYGPGWNECGTGAFLQQALFVQYGFPTSYCLESIVVRNRAGETVERVTLTRTHNTNGTPHHFLTGVRSLQRGEHRFCYDLSGYTLPKKDTQGTDHWGFWNGSSISDLRTLLSNGSTHLYDQTTDGAKDASFYYSKCGALTRITYPTGGTTEIEYEGNAVRRRLNRHEGIAGITLEPADSSNTNATWAVGGVRVKRLTDSDGSGTVRTTVFTYQDTQGHASGILMQMPRYCEHTRYLHRYDSRQNGSGVFGLAYVDATSFSNSLFPLSGDGHVAYPYVKVAHADGSYTWHRFTSVDDASLMDGRTAGAAIAKHTICDHDWIESPDGVGINIVSCLTPVTMDRKSLRGKPLAEVTYDASGMEIRRLENSYTSYSTTVGALCHNNTTCYNLTSYTAVCPLLLSTSETLHGKTVTAIRSYNAKGQLQSVTTTSVSAAPYNGYDPEPEVSRVWYRYLWEGAPSTTLTTAVDAAVRTRLRPDGTEHVTAAEYYSYGGWASAHNPRPTAISVFCHDGVTVLQTAGDRSSALSAGLTGTPRTTSVSYDGRFRPATLSFPGGAYISYTWDGTDLQTRTDDGPDNTTSFSWKGLVGPTLISSPSGSGTASFTYDANARLQEEKDPRGNTVSRYDYNLINEE